MTIRPTANRVLVRLAKESPTYGSIIKPTDYRKFICEGEVRAVGPDVSKLEVGDRVIIDVYEGIGVDDPETGLKHVLYEEDELLAVMEQVVEERR